MKCKTCNNSLIPSGTYIASTNVVKMIMYCTKCNSRFLYEMRLIKKLEPNKMYCSLCNKETYYYIGEEFSNWGAYERGEERAKTYKVGICAIHNCNLGEIK